MFKQAQMMYLFVDSPLHAGSGRGFGAVDQPIQRERISGLPLVQASGIKGAMRSESEAIKGDVPEMTVVFGPDSRKGVPDRAGALSAGDARLLLFPVRALAGVFAWTTSLMALNRFMRDCEFVKATKTWKLPNDIASRTALVTEKSAVVAGKSRIVLEEYAFQADATQSQIVNEIADWLAKNVIPTGAEYDYCRKKIAGKLVILPDDAFRDFTIFSTEVITRIRLNQATKTVEDGGLWTEEHLPVDSILYAPIAASNPRNDSRKALSLLTDAREVLGFVSGALDGRRIQLGGDETVGRGVVSLRFGAVSALTAEEQNHG